MKVQVKMFHSRETPGTHFYEAEDDDATIRNLYIKKRAFAGQGAPERITLTLESRDL